ncbi:MAG: glycosyl hydrolase [Bacteroidetes bacterium]|nr:glycosyl hydrolase [Bacteroidota bacterium]
MKIYLLTGIFLAILSTSSRAQNITELNTGWKCQAIGRIKAAGAKISTPDFSTKSWLDATVPGTVLTTLINNKLAPDPFYGLNNEQIPDIYKTGRDYYTYWFVKDFTETKRPSSGQQLWLNFRGVNYGCDIWLNGHRLNATTHFGMYLRQSYNITQYVNTGANRIAVIVYPPDPVGNPNGGQGGDGEIARNVSHQYVAGWDWIQPIRDRNTGIWDKVTLEHTGPVRIKNPHIVTEVAGQRFPDEANQAPAILRVSAEVENAGDEPVSGELSYTVDRSNISAKITLSPHEAREVQLPVATITNPRLWWPNGYGPQNLYHISLKFGTSDSLGITFGVRQITTSWNSITKSRETAVNGQKIFIKGGNWIVSDELLRFTPQRYDAEIRYHRDMNLNLIRVWGGALTERPEFYEACDRYGLLVFQDFWNSGDCNGRWEDPMKKEDQWTRRQYPNDHGLFITSVIDQVKMLRNHPSLAFWCGGNEITPPADILKAMRDSIMPALDGTRTFFDFSNSDSMSFNNFGSNGDGPYGIQDINTFWGKRTYPFNSEVGSVGMGDYESLQRFLPEDHRNPPVFPGKEDPVWNYHKYIGYDSSVYAYGPIKDLKDYAEKAQLVNYDQYRGLMEGFSSHMWDWYTGTIIWKTQNPWTALRGQMYDYYLDPNACLYGLHIGGESLHIQYDPVTGMVMIVNNGFRTQRDLMMQVRTIDMEGKSKLLTQVFNETGPTIAKNYIPIGHQVNRLRSKEGVFVSLRLLNEKQQTVSDNLYWLPDSTGAYSGLQHINKAKPRVDITRTNGRFTATITNPAGGPVAFFNRISLVNRGNRQRILPVFYSDNYFSILPGESKTITMDYTPRDGETPQVSLRGWNVEEAYY